MELFDKKFVHFMWDDELVGKKCFVNDCIDDLIEIVEKGDIDVPQEVEYSDKAYSPFQIYSGGGHFDYVFAYYDPNYEVKKAFYKEGKVIQFKDVVSGEWRSAYNPRWDLNIKYRIKPAEEEKWIVYLARQKNGLCYLTACREDMWESVQKDYGAKTKLFVGSVVEATAWYEARQRRASFIKAWEDGKTIQFYSIIQEDWIDSNANKPIWDVSTEYRIKPEEKEETKDKDKMNPIQEKKMRRYNLNLGDWDELKEMAVKMFKGIAALNERFAKKISEGEFVTQDDWKEMSGLWQTFNYINDDKKFCKEDLHHLFTDDLDEEFVEIEVEEAEEKKDEKLECPCEDGIDSKACVGCEHSEDGKPHTFENYHCYGCDKSSKKKYRPYESCAEMIMDFIDRFNADCPSYSQPSIWVKNKWSGSKFLITGIESSPYDGENVEFQCDIRCVSGLFDTYTYLDGSPCGMEVK